MPNVISYFEASPTHPRLAYRYTAPQPFLPTVVYLYGFRSNMNGEKVKFLETLCQDAGLGFLTFDYSGHGESSGNFEDGTITQWLADSLVMIDHLTKGPLILVGSSMGGWLALLAALQRPQRIVGLLGIASAPDFTEELMWKKFSPNQQTELMNQGWTVVSTEYNSKVWIITKNLIKSGRKHLLLGAPILLNIPMRFIHGMLDVSVPPSFSQKLLELVASKDVALTLLKSADHRLSEEGDRRILGHHLQELVASYLLTKPA
ncbi:MAG: alpha/beta hydrolase [Candidatus Paracaedibacter sp.]